MAASPPIKVYREGEYVASCKYFEDAAALAGTTTGTVVKWQGAKVIWVEGKEAIDACDSWDQAADIMQKRVAELNKAAYDKQHASRITHTSTDAEKSMADSVDRINKEKLPDVRW